MRDRWINIGCEGSELKPYHPPAQFVDDKRIGNVRRAAMSAVVGFHASLSVTAESRTTFKLPEKTCQHFKCTLNYVFNCAHMHYTYDITHYNNFILYAMQYVTIICTYLHCSMNISVDQIHTRVLT